MVDDLKGMNPMRHCSTGMKLMLVTVMASLLAGGTVLAAGPVAAKAAAPREGVPKLIDLGSKSCIPCKLMAPILEDLKKQYAGKMDVEFVDVSIRENLPKARQYGIRMIPTQIFLDANGKELWRHEGFISGFGILDKFRELGYGFAAEALKPGLTRMEPVKKDTRTKDAMCFMCDGDLPDETLVVVKTDKGDVKLCGMHHFFVMYSCMTEDTAGLEKKVSVATANGGAMVPLADAVFLYGVDEKTGRPWIKAFTDRAAAQKHQATASGSLLAYEALKRKELAPRCGFCDRATYPEDAAAVHVGGIRTCGCCSHCALGVAAKTGGTIEVRQPDRRSGKMITVRTLGGYVVSVEPKTAVAWFGLRRKPDGSFGSAGCFHQGFFTSEESLKKWLEENPMAVGKMISIDQALADKMKLSPAQIAKACKVGECAPK